MASIIGRLFRSYRCSPTASSFSGIVRCYYGSSSTGSISITTEYQYTGRSYLPPKDNGRDKNHWLIHTKEPHGSREEMVATYINLVASVLGSEEEAKKRMYSVSTKYYYGIGAIMTEDVAMKFKGHPAVVDVIEDAYVDPVTKDYGGEPIIDGKVVPYHPKHHDLYHRAQEALREGMIEDDIEKYLAKEAKKIKDPNKPKRPPSAFVLFMKGFRKEFKDENPNVKGVATMAKAGGERWRLMTDDEKAAFVCAADEMKKDYQKKIKAYEKKQVEDHD